MAIHVGSAQRIKGSVTLACRLQAAPDLVMMMMMMVVMVMMMRKVMMMMVRVLQCSERGALAAGRNAPGCFH